jgi:hypothetical protein
VNAPTALGDVIAERHLVLTAADRPARDVVVQLGRPVAMGGVGVGDDCWCAVQVAIDGHAGPVRAIGGVDAVQALHLAWAFAELQLSLLARDEGGTLRWPGGDLYESAASAASPSTSSDRA